MWRAGEADNWALLEDREVGGVRGVSELVCWEFYVLAISNVMKRIGLDDRLVQGFCNALCSAMDAIDAIDKYADKTF